MSANDSFSLEKKGTYSNQVVLPVSNSLSIIIQVEAFNLANNNSSNYQQVIQQAIKQIIQL